MSTTHEIYFKRIDVVDRKLPLFCLMAKHELKKKFTVKKNDTVFQLRLGLTDDLIHSYTDIEFEAELDTDLALFAKEIPLIVDTEHLKIESAEGATLNEAKEAEQIKLEEQLSGFFPVVLEAINTFRTACKVALFRESVAGRVLSRNIQAKQLHWGVEVSHSLEEHFSGSDTEFLFGAFANLSLSSFAGDADIEYRVTSPAGEVYEGVFKNGYDELHSPERLRQELTVVQDLLDNGWSIATDILLVSLEYLYSDNYQMAVFNAATLLELAVVGFWEEKKKQLTAGARQEKEKAARLDRRMKDSCYPTKIEKIIRVVLPDFVRQDFVTDGTLDRCVAAWHIRNNRLAHPYVQVKEGKQIQVTVSEAWDAVTSIIDLLDAIRKSEP